MKIILHSPFFILHSSFKTESLLVVVFVFEVVRYSETITGRSIHLLGGSDSILQFCDSILDLGEFGFDLVFEVVDLFSGYFQSSFVKLALLVGKDRHKLSPEFPEFSPSSMYGGGL